MISTRTLRPIALLTLALATFLGMSTSTFGQATKAETSAKAKEKAKVAEAAKGPIDLNSATIEELQTLPGVGEVTARKIIDSRPHKAIADLASAGVPASTIDKIKPLVEVKPLPTPVDANLDPVEKIQTLPGIGPVLAKEIVAARPHAGYESLAKLKGIGPEKLDALKGRLKFGETEAVAKAKAKAKAAQDFATTKEVVTEKVADVAVAKKAVMRKAEEKATTKVAEAKEVAKEKEAPTSKLAPGTKVNINTADKDTLDALPGIGPVKAQAILDYRATAKFETIEDIMKVKGIKEGEFGKIKDMIKTK